ncbi:hypothetical protein FOE78_08710 [Microlunatus elymi]|uniref:DUF222 domain-containing protein n=1 Tax=Microlunatus elymi TaxID=2596828 RepID=A0A516PYC3_9ACTN|nr:hypothetical protein [Microlunatus elymi]QDP95971.1 hypothetical protein FOE78_08710 [Microlunatus elymi]
MEQAGLVDAAVADYVGRLGRAALMRLVEAKIIEVDADRIAAEAERRQREKGVWVGQATEHGCKTVFARADACDVIWFDAMVDRFADLLGRRGDDRTKDERRAAAIGILANPAYALRLLAEDEAPSLFDPALDDEELPEGDHDPVVEGLPVESGADGRVDGPSTSSGPWAGSSDRAESATDDPAGEHPAQPAGPELVEGPETQPGRDHPVRYPRFDHDHNLARAAIRAISQLDPAKLRPDATLYLHIAHETLQHGLGVVRVEDIGPVVSSLVADWLHGCQVTVKPVIDLNADLLPVDAYEIPRPMRERMFLKRPGSDFPFSTSTGPHLDLDHSDPYRPGRTGQTRENNLGPEARPEHRVITHGLWNRRQPEPGTVLFRAPYGRVFLVNSTGAHDLGEGPFAHHIWQAAAPTHD